MTKYTKSKTKVASKMILIGLFSVLLFVPSQNFQASFLVGNLISIEYFTPLITTNLLFLSFTISIIIPLIIISIYSLRNSFK